MIKNLENFPKCIFLLTLFFSISQIPQVMGTESEAIERISMADDTLKTAYLYLLESEKLGGDVSELATLINNALELHSEAIRAFESAEYERAYHLAERVVRSSNLVIEVSVELKILAKQEKDAMIRLQMIKSVGFICFTILFSYISWRLFKSYYLWRIEKMNREAISYEP